jgi:hypothetical protein
MADGLLNDSTNAFKIRERIRTKKWKEKVMFRVKRDKQAFFVGPDIEPVMKVPDGATVIFETSDCFRGAVENPEDCFSSLLEKKRNLNDALKLTVMSL